MKQRIMIVIMLVGTVAARSGVAADWPQWRGPDRTGISKETGWLTQWPPGGLKKLWDTEVGIGISSVTVSNGKLFTMGNTKDTDTVFCLDAVTGKQQWKYDYACKLDASGYEGGPTSTPTVDGDFVYTLSKAGHLFCLKTADGKVAWSKHLVNDFKAEVPQWGFAASPLVLGDSLIVTAGGDGTACLALKKTDGTLLWKAGNDKGAYATAQPFELDGNKMIAEFNGFGLVIRDLTQGEELARVRWKTSYDVNAISPIVDGNKVFIASGYSKGGLLVQIKGHEYEEIWKQKRIRSDYSTPVLWNKHLYGFDGDALVAIDFSTGDVKWSQDGFGKGALIMADGKLIVQTEKSGELVLVDAHPEAYKELGRTKVFDGKSSVMPVLANGLLYAKSNTGTVVCIDARGK